MENKNQIKKVILVLVATLIFHGLVGFYHHIDKYLTGWVFLTLTLLVPISFIVICYFAISGLIQIIRNRRKLTLTLCLPAIIAFAAIFFPWGFSSESLESKVEMRACYEGTQNQSTIKFRADSSFEVHSTGVFFADFWSKGRWSKSEDTIFMKFDGEKTRLLSDTIIIREEFLIPISEVKAFDSLKNYHRHYYLGYCKGEN